MPDQIPRDTPLEEIEVSPAMIEAGFEGAREFLLGADFDEMAKQVFIWR